MPVQIKNVQQNLNTDILIREVFDNGIKVRIPNYDSLEYPAGQNADGHIGNTMVSNSININVEGAIHPLVLHYTFVILNISVPAFNINRLIQQNGNPNINIDIDIHTQHTLHVTVRPYTIQRRIIYNFSEASTGYAMERAIHKNSLQADFDYIVQRDSGTVNKLRNIATEIGYAIPEDKEYESLKQLIKNHPAVQPDFLNMVETETFRSMKQYIINNSDFEGLRFLDKIGNWTIHGISFANGQYSIRLVKDSQTKIIQGQCDVFKNNVPVR